MSTRGAVGVALVAALAVAAPACTSCASRAGADARARAGGAGAQADAGVDAGADAAAGADAPAGADAAARTNARGDTARPELEEIEAVLFGERSAAVAAACPVSLAGDARVRCLYGERYKADAKAAGIAYELLVRWQTVAGVEVAHTMNGGYRGMIRIEPAVPVGENRRHLEWVAGAMRDFETFFAELERSRGGVGRSVLFSAAEPSPRPYRFYPLTLRFMRSVAARTPAAYAHDWTVAYNFVGTLNVSAEAVRETMFHEIFHLNDEAHGGWSTGALGTVFDAVAKKCGTSIPCLAPYTPNDTIVRGGTYYSFQPGNGVTEYAAELALRYYREQRATLRGLAKVKAFKCGPSENAKAWSAMRDEFFAGIDTVPECR